MFNERITIDIGNIDEAIEVMREAAQWLIDRGKPLWNLEDLTREKLLEDNYIDEFYVLKVDNEAAGAMIIKREDSLFWPDDRKGECAYIHKLSVKRKYAGTGISRNMIAYAAGACQKEGISFLKLDCAGDREKLCGFYESIGFRQAARKIIGLFDVALYEMEL